MACGSQRTIRNEIMDRQQSISKFLSFVLRHQPEAVGLTLGDGGWVAIDDLLAALVKHGRPLDRAALEAIVAASDKQRFAVSSDGTAIRANQGHSVRVELGLSPVAPPAVLFHGTVERFLPSIRVQGLVKGQRHHVHLSAARELALVVGARRGSAIALEVDAQRMAKEGFDFYCTDNGVWLTDHVPPGFLSFAATTG